MPAKNLTDSFTRNVRPTPGKQTRYLDRMERGLSLELVVSYAGTKTFRALTYRNGKPVSVKLGSYPALTVKEARSKAREIWTDPKKFAAQAAVGTFGEIAANWIVRHVAANKLRSQPEIERMLERYVYPKWKERPFLEIRRRDVNDLLDGIADNHGRSQADAVLATIRAIMTWHQARDENYTSPIVRGMQRQKSKARNRVLDDDEIRAVWKVADAHHGSFGAIVKLALLTGQRRDKIATMRWGDLKEGLWTIRTEEREKGSAGQLKLPKIALDIIEKQPQIAGNPHVFPGHGRGRSRQAGKAVAFNAWSQRKQEIDAKLPADMPAWVVHDLRRTARSLMSRADVRPDIAERVLGHAIAGVEGVYDRHHYDEQKADALARLATLIETILNPPADNVVVLRK